MKNNFEELKQYFENISDEDVLSWKDKCPYIEFDYLASSVLDFDEENSDILRTVISDLMKEMNPKYAFYSARNFTTHTNHETGDTYQTRNTPQDLQGIRIINNNGRLILQIIGADNRTKLNITDRHFERDNTSEKQIPIITIDELAQIIADKYADIDLTSSIEILGLKGESAERYIEKYRQSESKNAHNLEKAKIGLNQTFGNLLAYYKYLLEYSKYLEYSNVEQDTNFIINQRRDEKTRGPAVGPYPPVRPTRLNDVIDVNERMKVLTQLNPTYVITMGEKVDTGEVVLNSYNICIYRNSLEKMGEKQDGWLFVCEPTNGTRSTRLFFLTNEEFERFNIGNSNNRLLSIAKSYLDMSQTEFIDTKGTLSLNHTNLEKFTEKMNLYIQGDKPKDNITSHVRNMRGLYRNDELTPPYYHERKPKTASDIGIIGAGAHRIDRTAQESIRETEDRTNEEGEEFAD